MKKVLSLVLCLAMVLSVCVTLFAAPAAVTAAGEKIALVVSGSVDDANPEHYVLKSYLEGKGYVVYTHRIKGTGVAQQSTWTNFFASEDFYCGIIDPSIVGDGNRAALYLAFRGMVANNLPCIWVTTPIMSHAIFHNNSTTTGNSTVTQAEALGYTVVSGQSAHPLLTGLSATTAYFDNTKPANTPTAGRVGAIGSTPILDGTSGFQPLLQTSATVGSSPPYNRAILAAGEPGANITGGTETVTFNRKCVILGVPGPVENTEAPAKAISGQTITPGTSPITHYRQYFNVNEAAGISFNTTYNSGIKKILDNALDWVGQTAAPSGDPVINYVGKTAFLLPASGTANYALKANVTDGGANNLNWSVTGTGVSVQNSITGATVAEDNTLTITSAATAGDVTLTFNINDGNDIDVTVNQTITLVPPNGKKVSLVVSLVDEYNVLEDYLTRKGYSVVLRSIEGDAGGWPLYYISGGGAGSVAAIIDPSIVQDKNATSSIGAYGNAFEAMEAGGVPGILMMTPIMMHNILTGNANTWGANTSTTANSLSYSVDAGQTAHPLMDGITAGGNPTYFTLSRIRDLSAINITKLGAAQSSQMGGAATPALPGFTRFIYPSNSSASTNQTLVIAAESGGQIVRSFLTGGSITFSQPFVGIGVPGPAAAGTATESYAYASNPKTLAGTAGKYTPNKDYVQFWNVAAAAFGYDYNTTTFAYSFNPSFSSGIKKIFDNALDWVSQDAPFPRNLNVTAAGANTIDLAWNVIPGAVSYKIEIDEVTQNGITVNEPNSVHRTATVPITAGSCAKYTVRGYDGTATSVGAYDVVVKHYDDDDAVAIYGAALGKTSTHLKPFVDYELIGNDLRTLSIIVGQYAADKQLLDVSFGTGDVAINGSADEANMFIWDTMSNITPLYEKKVCDLN